MHSRLSNVTVQMLLYLCVNLRLMNKLTNEMGNFFTDTMRDSNSHEFEEMVDPITCTPNEEPEENVVEIDETFSEKESSVTNVFSWSNFPVQNCGSAATSGAKRHKADSSVVVIAIGLSPRVSPQRGLVLRV